MSLFLDSVVMVFCKAPMPGQVKTRLIPPLTSEEAAQLHCELTQQTLTTATQNNLTNVELWCSPSTDHAFFQALSQTYSVNLQAQHGADLGERMHHAFCHALTKHQSAIIIGCDCPSLTNADIKQALTLLNQGHDCVIAPAEDGGYGLIGVTKPQQELFTNMPWGTSQVNALTLAKLNELDLSYQLLAQQWDVDTPADLIRYRNTR